MDQKSVEERLVRRGELLLRLGFLQRYADESEAMNRGKEGRPFTLTNSYIDRSVCEVPGRSLSAVYRAWTLNAGISPEFTRHLFT